MFAESRAAHTVSECLQLQRSHQLLPLVRYSLFFPRCSCTSTGITTNTTVENNQPRTFRAPLRLYVTHLPLKLTINVQKMYNVIDPENCLKLDMLHGPSHTNKVKQYEIVFKVSLLIQSFSLFSLICCGIKGQSMKIFRKICVRVILSFWICILRSCFSNFNLFNWCYDITISSCLQTRLESTTGLSKVGPAISFY